MLRRAGVLQLLPAPAADTRHPLAPAMRTSDVVSIVVSAASAGLSVGVVVGRTTVVEVREVRYVEAPPVPAVPAPVELRRGVPGSALQPVVPADLYVQRMAALRQRCVGAGDSFGVVAVEEGVFGECWDPRRDERAWAEWVGVASGR